MGPQDHRSTPQSVLTNRHGAVFLLAAYFASLMLLTLTGIALQRTTMELRAAEVSRDMQQSFYLAEAGLDRAIQDIRTNSTVMSPTAVELAQVTSPTGTFAYSAQTITSQIGFNGQLTSVQQITGSGVSAGRTTSVRASMIPAAQTLSGVTANSDIEIQRSPSGRPITIRGGDIQNALGKSQAIYVEFRSTVDADIMVAPPLPQDQGGYQVLVSDESGDKPAVLDGGAFLDPRHITQDVLAPFLASGSPAGCQNFNTPWVVNANQTVDIRDGDPLDQIPGDGQILMCLSQATINTGAEVKFRKPALIYVQGRSFNNKGTIRIVGYEGRRDRGLTVALTPTADVMTSRDGSRGEVIAGDFEGSIYAPASHVYIGETQTERQYENPESDDYDRRYVPPERKLGFVIANTLVVEGVDVLTKKAPRTTHEDDASERGIVSWTNH